MEIDYERDLFIDETALDVEWLNQPSLMMRYCKLLATARKEVDRLKEKMVVIKAQMDHEIRSRPEAFDIIKITETAVQNCIILQDEYRKAMAELIDAQYEHQMIQGAVTAVDARKQALESLSRLLGLQYFAGPKTPRDLPYEVQQAQKRQHSNQVVKIKRRSK